MLISGTTPETPSGSTSTTKSGGSSGHQAADSGHPDSPEVPEVTELSGSLNNPDSVNNVGPPPPLPSQLHESENGGVDPLGPLPPNWELAYTDKGDYFEFFREIRFLNIYFFTIFLTKNFVKSCLFF